MFDINRIQIIVTLAMVSLILRKINNVLGDRRNRLLEDLNSAFFFIMFVTMFLYLWSNLEEIARWLVYLNI